MLSAMWRAKARSIRSALYTCVAVLTMAWLALAAAPPALASQDAVGQCWTWVAKKFYGPTRQTFSACAETVGLLTRSTSTSVDGESYGMWNGFWVASNRRGEAYWAKDDGAFEWQFWGYWDRDGDSVPNSRDACARAETLNGIFDADGCPDTMRDLIQAATTDLDSFWSRSFASSHQQYRSPDVTLAGTSIASGCGRATSYAAFYCFPDEGIYLQDDFLAAQLKDFGDFAPVVITAHEWGHHIQNVLDIRDGQMSIDAELQADCFAGAYTRHAQAAGYLEEGDLEEGVASLFSVGDPQGTPWFDEDAHGTSEQRIRTFGQGFRGGLRACAGALR